jgi:hypothetical protein
VSEQTGEAQPPPEAEAATVAPHAPTRDLFASAVHRFGAAWADLVVGAVVALVVATIPVVVVHQGGGSDNEAALIGRFAYGIAYFAVVAFVMLRGLPQPAPRRRVAWTYATAVMIGIVAAFLLAILGPYAVVPMPLLLFAVPAIAAGDVQPGGAIARSAGLAARNFSRTWLVWLITILFGAPIVVSMALIVYAFATGGTAFLAGLAMAAPIVWPFSALFTRALYADLTGRNVVAPQDRTI